MNILIIGSGAIGIAVGASLSSVGCTVHFFASERTKAEIDKGGVRRSGIFGDCFASEKDVSAFCDYDLLPLKYDYIIIAAKSFSNEEISRCLDKHRQIFATNGKIVIMQNGIGNDEPYKRLFDESVIYNARVITGFLREKLNKSTVTVHNAPLLFGSLYGFDNEPVKPLVKLLCESNIPSECCDDIGAALWSKLLYNTTLNPLGAVLHCTYGQLYESVNARKIMEQLVLESFLVLDSQKGCMQNAQKDAENYIDELYNKLIPNTYSHCSSTLQDIEKKQKTEIDTLNGSIVRLGRKYDVKTPYHDMICSLIHAMEDNY